MAGCKVVWVHSIPEESIQCEKQHTEGDSLNGISVLIRLRSSSMVFNTAEESISISLKGTNVLTIH